jgi:NAD(P)-dependent dehydrogenase (short-subunit alcohol dehydrogenase family)
MNYMNGVRHHRTSVVVGGTGGIGSHIVRKLAAAGDEVVIVYRSAEAKARELAAEVQAGGGTCVAMQADMTSPDQVSSVFEQVIDRFGRIDVLVNTQGYIHQLALLHEEPLADMKRSVDVELMSVIYSCRAVIPHMIRQGSGRIVTIGSDSGKVGSTAEAVSAACRGGIIAFSKSVAREVARHGVTVNVICPGPTDTDLLDKMQNVPGLTAKLMAAMVRAIPMRRPGKAAEVADAAVFIASPQASYITGQALSVSGGLTMC